MFCNINPHALENPACPIGPGHISSKADIFRTLNMNLHFHYIRKFIQVNAGNYIPVIQCYAMLLPNTTRFSRSALRRTKPASERPAFAAS